MIIKTGIKVVIQQFLGVYKLCWVEIKQITSVAFKTIDIIGLGVCDAMSRQFV